MPPKCKQEYLIETMELYITVIKEPNAQTQSRRFCEIALTDHRLNLLL